MSHDNHEDETIDFAAMWPNKYQILGGNRAGKTVTSFKELQEMVLREMTGNLEIPSDIMDDINGNVSQTKIKHNFYNTNLGIASYERCSDSRIQDVMRNLGTPCAICGQRPGLWVTYEPQFREFTIRFNCHGETELISIPEEEIQRRAGEAFLSIIPFRKTKLAREANNKPKPLPAPKKVIVTEMTHKIRLE